MQKLSLNSGDKFFKLPIYIDLQSNVVYEQRVTITDSVIFEFTFIYRQIHHAFICII